MHLPWRTTAVLVSLLFLSPLAQAVERPRPAAPELQAKAWILMDFHSRQVLAEHHADQPLPPASLTKIMTSYVVQRELQAGHIALDDQVTVSKKAWRTGGSRMFIEVGKQVSVEDLLKGMVIQSGNDASVALAEHVAGSEATFAQMMNNEAQRLGMQNTHFANSTGLPGGEQHTTARDLAILSAALIRDFPEHYNWYSIKEFTFNGIRQHNRNSLLWRDKRVDGIKTGHTEAAGYCLVASAEQGPMRQISVVLGTKSNEARTKASQALLNYGFRFFETHRLYPAGQALANTRIWKGTETELPLGLAEDLYVTVPSKDYNKLQAHLEVQPALFAPVTQGQEVGKVVVQLADQTLVKNPLVALRPVAEGNLWQKLRDKALLWMK